MSQRQMCGGHTSLRDADADALAKHKDTLDALLKEKARLERSLEHPDGDDVPALSRSEAASPQPIRPVTPMDEDVTMPEVAVKEEIVEEDVVSEDAPTPVEKKPLEVSHHFIPDRATLLT